MTSRKVFTSFCALVLLCCSAQGGSDGHLLDAAVGSNETEGSFYKVYTSADAARRLIASGQCDEGSFFSGELVIETGSGTVASPFERTKMLFVSGRREGESVHDIGGTIIEKTEYKHSLQDGQSLFYQSSGRISHRATFERGLLNGELVEYWENGNIKRRAYFYDNRLHGASVEYYLSGSKKAEKYFKKCYPDGIWNDYNESGMVIRRKQYCDGKACGNWYDLVNGEMIKIDYYNVKPQSYCKDSLPISLSRELQIENAEQNRLRCNQISEKYL